MLSAGLLLLVFVPMLLEARRSNRNDRGLRAAGAVEPDGDVYQAMQVAYPLSFLLPIAEGFVRARPASAATVLGLVLFLLAKALKYWAIATLGERWTFRVLVPPRSSRTVGGPYRWLRHPNYVAVAGEIAGVAVMTQAWITGALMLIIFTLLMRARVRVEEHALGLPRR
ncbi:MAG: isoprenylcysteine carboxylmethyltransferase family protein [Vicinamibacterales bacterium]